jgi:hypothetical protein
MDKSSQNRFDRRPRRKCVGSNPRVNDSQSANLSIVRDCDCRLIFWKKGPIVLATRLSSPSPLWGEVITDLFSRRTFAPELWQATVTLSAKAKSDLRQVVDPALFFAQARFAKV